MKLRTKLFAAVFAVAFVLIAAATVATRQTIAQSYRQDFRALRHEVETALARELALRLEAIARAADNLADRGHPLLLAIEERRARAAMPLTAADRHALHRVATAAMVALGVDELIVADEDQRVVVAPHNMALVGERVPLLWALGQPGGFSADLSASHEARAVAARRVTEGGTQLAVFVARRLDASVLAVAARPGLVSAALLDATGRQVFTNGDISLMRGPTAVTVPVQDANGASLGALVAYMSDSTLRGVLRRLTYVAIVASLGALLLAALLATWLARRVSARMDELMVAANAVAQGDYSRRVAVQGTDEVAQLGGVFNHMVAQINDSKEKLAWAERTSAWQEIARHLAHEIKNPLTPIQMSMDTLRRSYERSHPAFGDILAESTATVLQEAERLKRFATEFGTFARLPKPMRQIFELSGYVKALVALRPDVGFQAAEAPLMIDGDRDQLAQVLHNLLDNAADATAQSHGLRPPLIAVALALEPEAFDGRGGVVWTVTDNGEGIDPAIADQLFTPYVTSKRERGGTGLGLAIVHRIVVEHGGVIAATDAAPGTRFTIRLPLASTG